MFAIRRMFGSPGGKWSYNLFLVSVLLPKKKSLAAESLPYAESVSLCSTKTFMKQAPNNLEYIIKYTVDYLWLEIEDKKTLRECNAHKIFPFKLFSI